MSVNMNVNCAKRKPYRVTEKKFDYNIGNYVRSTLTGIKSCVK